MILILTFRKMNIVLISTNCAQFKHYKSLLLAFTKQIMKKIKCSGIFLKGFMIVQEGKTAVRGLSHKEKSIPALSTTQIQDDGLLLPLC